MNIISSNNNHNPPKGKGLERRQPVSMLLFSTLHVVVIHFNPVVTLLWESRLSASAV